MLRKIITPLLAMAILLVACAPTGTPPMSPTSIPTVMPTAAPTLVPTVMPTIAPTPAPIVLKDGLGNTVTLQTVPQRIISLAPSNTELLFAVDAGDQVVGRDELSDYPEAAQQIKNLGSMLGKFDTAAIVALKPDLILAAKINPPEQIQALQDLGLTVCYVSNPKDFDDLSANVLMVGQLTGHTAEAEKLTSDLKARFYYLNNKIAVTGTYPKVYYEPMVTDPAKPYIGDKSYVSMIILLAGGQHVGAKLSGQSAPNNSAELIKLNPDVIVVGVTASDNVTVDSISQRPGWDSIAAVKNKQVYLFDDRLLNRPSPRLVDGLEQLAKLLHPEAFK